MKNIFDRLIGYRYFIAILALVLGVTLNLHGSSINNWSNMGVKESITGEMIETQNEYQTDTGILDTLKLSVEGWISVPPKEDGTIVGVPRMIRSDEWLVQTPLYLSQSSTGNNLVNKSYALSGQNMIVAYNAPVKHISVVGKPFNWGFLFLGSEKGLSWYWCFKIIGFLLLSFEFTMILTKKNRLLSLLGSLWITFTPTLQWWFMQHLGDTVFFALLLMVSIFHFFHSSSLTTKLMCATLIAVGMIGFVLIIYPAFQVIFAYIIAAFFAIEFLKAWKQKKISPIDWLIILTTLGFALIIIAYSLWNSLDAILLTLNTVYPGSRISVGGEISFSQISESIINLLLPFKVPHYSNQVELSSAVHFAPLCLLLLPFTFAFKNIKEEAVGILLLLAYVLLCFYSIQGFSEKVAKITLFSFVTGSRSWQAASVIGVFFTLWFWAYIWEIRQYLRKVAVVAVLIVATLSLYFSISDANLLAYMKLLPITIVMLLIFTIFLLFIFGKSKLAVLTMTMVVLISGATVNPIVYGLETLEAKSLSVKIKEIVKVDSQAFWIADNSYLYQYPQMFGAKSLDGVRFYPDITLMTLLDPNKHFENEWNRYAHVHYTLVLAETSMGNPAPDNLHVNLSVDKLDELNIKYILSNRDLNREFGERFKLIYGPDLDGNRIYQFK
ncbi:TPA: hypothetical protein U2D44_001027 [Streptococcus suis]|nr:hypothetical protein [Streptococcus suis]HEM6305979.1 hypothetical protein [Streptococcus suis]HEM6419201.1 hypothetical protein [Streptococcus suis]HEM6425426.1 hypothetical protein [Streptococcus suis]HEM6431715.1 hypothetical protein [Streptococcus suis]